MKLAGLLMFISDVHSLGLAATQGMYLADPWYWDRTAETRAWSKRYFEKTKREPTSTQAADYSAVTTYLKAVQAAGTDDADKVVAQLEGKKVNDFFLRNGEFRAADHRVLHDAYLAKVKPGSEVKEPWDYEQIVKTIPAQEAFRAPSADCKL
jgi:branched-chain amino acid transport system substrate-binding protein